MTRLSLIGILTGNLMQSSGPSGPVNTVAPAIASSAVIGTLLTVTPGTWTGATTLTYQWQRNSGSWVDIGGATNTTYTPVDADFGRALRVVETADGSVSADSNATALTVETPVQSLGAELLTNGDFSAWTGDDPNGWAVVNESGSDPAVSQVAPDGSAGTGAARFYSSATTGLAIWQNLSGANNYVEDAVVISAYTQGGVRSEAPRNGVTSSPYASTGHFRRLVYSPSISTYETQLIGTLPCDVVVNTVSLKNVNMNTSLTAPSANMVISQYYTLPGSPLVGDQLWVMTRISDFAAGNYWLTLLEHTGTQWNITLFSVASHTRTSRIAATNIGTSNGLRINMNADSITLETTANGGANWTSRGSVTNNTYQTATGVNAMWTSSVTIGNLAYAVP